MSSPFEQQYGASVETPRSVAHSTPEAAPAKNDGHGRIRRLELKRITLDRKISPYFAT